MWIRPRPQSNVPLATSSTDGPGRRRVGDEAVDVVRTLAPVEAVALQHEPLAGHVLSGVVGRRARQRRLRPLRVGGQVRGHGAQDGGRSQEVGAGSSAAGSASCPRDGAVERRRLAGEQLLRPDDVSEAGSAGLHGGVEDALERVREGAGRHGCAGRETGVLADGEGVGPCRPGRRRAPPRRARRRGEAGGERLVGIGHERAARGAEERDATGSLGSAGSIVLTIRSWWRRGTCRPP